MTEGWLRSRRTNARRSCSSLPHVEDFVEDQDSHSIRQFEQLRSRRIVGGANGIGAHLLQHLELALRRAVVECRAERSEIVMIVHAIERNALLVDEDPLARVEPHGANAESRFVTIDDPVSLRKRGDGHIAVWGLLRHRPPQPGIPDDRRPHDFDVASGGYRRARLCNTRNRPPHPSAIGIECVNRCGDIYGLHGARVVVDRHFQLDGRRSLRDVRCLHEGPPLAYMDRMSRG
jgi:hypothetical protein